MYDIYDISWLVEVFISITFLFIVHSSPQICSLELNKLHCNSYCFMNLKRNIGIFLNYSMVLLSTLNITSPVIVF